MVVETKFRVSRYAQDVPLSLGSPAEGVTSIYLPGAPLPWQRGYGGGGGRTPISIGTPGSLIGAGDYGYPIVDPNPGSCINGFTKNWLGQCVPISSLPQCPTGYARDAAGNCVQVPVTPTPYQPGMSAQIVRIQLPRTFIQGKTVTLRTWFQNYRSDAPLYAVKIDLPGISFTHTTQPIPANVVGQTVRIDSTFTVPNFAQVMIYPPPPITGTVSLKRLQQVQCVTAPCNPTEVENADTENITLYTSGATAPPPTPTCPTGYTGTYPNCVPPVTPVPTPTPTPIPIPIPPIPTTGCPPGIAKNLPKFIAKRNQACAGTGPGDRARCIAFDRVVQQFAARCGQTIPPVTPPTTTAASITLTPSTVPKRGVFVVNGTGFRGREAVHIRIVIAGKESRTAQVANTSGQIRKNIRAPNKSGTGTVTARGNKSNAVASAPITVT